MVSHNGAKDVPFLDVQPDAYYYDAVLFDIYSKSFGIWAKQKSGND